jgi:hypothetical protein
MEPALLAKNQGLQINAYRFVPKDNGRQLGLFLAISARRITTKIPPEALQTILASNALVLPSLTLALRQSRIAKEHPIKLKSHAKPGFIHHQVVSPACLATQAPFKTTSVRLTVRSVRLARLMTRRLPQTRLHVGFVYLGHLPLL